MMTTLPPDLQDVLDQIDRAEQGAVALVAGLSDEQLHWQPHDGRWSVAQCLEHLAMSNDVYCAATAGAVETARRRGWKRRTPIASTWAGRWFIGDLEPPVKRRARAPGKVRPASSRTREEILRIYHDAHRTIRSLVTACADIDVNRARFRNPFFPLLRVRVGTGLRVMPAHERRHLWQAEQVPREPGFPAHKLEV